MPTSGTTVDFSQGLRLVDIDVFRHRETAPLFFLLLPFQRRAPSKKNAASSWDWDFQRPRVIRPLAGALEADLKELYRMDQPEEHLLNLFSR
jgi:hypothetical protein